MPPELVTRIKTRFPNVERGVSQVYGLSEGGRHAHRPPRGVTSSSGRAPPVGRCRWSTSASTAPTTTGTARCVARTPTQMLGYWGQASDDAIDEEGWLHTGDLGHLDGDGYLFITGRMKDLIIRGGENIAAPHVENVLLRHPGIRDVAVCGRPDPDLGEIVAAAVVLDPSSTVTVAELRAFAAEHLAYFEIPTSWWLRTDPLPSNDVGKVQKRRAPRHLARSRPPRRRPRLTPHPRAKRPGAALRRATVLAFLSSDRWN